jgi:hypothetical protein
MKSAAIGLFGCATNQKGSVMSTSTPASATIRKIDADTRFEAIDFVNRVNFLFDRWQPRQLLEAFSDEISFGQDMPAIAAAREEIVSSMPAVSRRTFLATGTAAGASLLLGQMAEAESFGGADGLKDYDIATNGISLHVTEQGEGPAVLFCHGFRIPPIRGADR